MKEFFFFTFNHYSDAMMRKMQQLAGNFMASIFWNEHGIFFFDHLTTSCFFPYLSSTVTIIA